MMALFLFLARLRGDARGSAVIETALAAPLLLTLALGTVEVGSIVARQVELQNAVANVVAIAAASPPTTESQRATIIEILQTTANVPADQVTVTEVYRCGTASSTTDDKATCGESAEGVSTFLLVRLTDTYMPSWADFGVGEEIDFEVSRTVQIS